MTSQPAMSPKEYQHLLEKLLLEGKGFGKTAEVVVLPAPEVSLDFVTEDIQKGLDYLRRGITPQMIEHGFKLQPKKFTSTLYQPSDPADPGNGLMKPNPDGYRLALKLDETVVIPSSWDSGSIDFSAGGYLFIQQKYVVALSQALISIAEGKETPEQALYKDIRGGRVAKFDLYGHDGPDLDSLGYAPVELRSNVKEIAASFAAAATAKEALKQLPFTRRGKQLVGDHAAPERAAFKKRTRTITPN